jgi:hypothetical protein
MMQFATVLASAELIEKEKCKSKLQQRLQKEKQQYQQQEFDQGKCHRRRLQNRRGSWRFYYFSRAIMIKK